MGSVASRIATMLSRPFGYHDAAHPSAFCALRHWAMCTSCDEPSIAPTTGWDQCANLNENQFCELFTARQSLNLIPRNDHHANLMNREFCKDKSVSPTQVLGLAGDAVGGDEDAKAHSTTPDFRQDPCHVLAIHRVVPTLALNEEEFGDVAQPARMILIQTRNVDLFRDERIHCIACRDLDAGQSVHKVATGAAELEDRR